MKIPDRPLLEKRRAIIIADLLAKVEAEDFHGVQDCASDIREIDAQLIMLTPHVGQTTATAFRPPKSA